MSKKNPALGLEEITDLFKEALRDSVFNPTIYAYRPHSKQEVFHKSDSLIRLLIGGNRSGKTVAGVSEDVHYLRGAHPFKKVPSPPVRGRIVSVSFREGVEEVIIPELKRWLPPSDLINGSWEDSYNKAKRKLTLSNKSTCELMSYDQDLDKFSGTSRHFTHFDEEPPKDIYNECMLRLVDTEGKCWITMTPVEGMTWIYDEIYEKGIAGSKTISVFIVDSEENPYISKEALELVLSGLDKFERQARKEGKFVQLGGLAFKEFRPNLHIIPALTEEDFKKIRSWVHYRHMDHGLNAPAVWLWSAVSPQGSVVTYDEIYQPETLIPEFAALIKERESQPYRVTPDITIGDPAIAQRNAQTGDSVQVAYAKHGIYIALGNNDQKIGVEKMNRYFKTGRYAITESCPQTSRDLQRQRWKIYHTAKLRQDNPPREELDRKWSHGPDTIRYLFSIFPDLYIPPTELTRVDINKAVQELVGAITPSVGPYYFDNNLQTPKTRWTNIDEHFGEVW